MKENKYGGMEQISKYYTVMYNTYYLIHSLQHKQSACFHALKKP